MYITRCTAGASFWIAVTLSQYHNAVACGCGAELRASQPATRCRVVVLTIIHSLEESVMTFNGPTKQHVLYSRTTSDVMNYQTLALSF
jgi:hypothetical protein